MVAAQGHSKAGAMTTTYPPPPRGLAPDPATPSLRTSTALHEKLEPVQCDSTSSNAQPGESGGVDRACHTGSNRRERREGIEREGGERGGDLTLRCIRLCIVPFPAEQRPADWVKPSEFEGSVLGCINEQTPNS